MKKIILFILIFILTTIPVFSEDNIQSVYLNNDGIYYEGENSGKLIDLKNAVNAQEDFISTNDVWGYDSKETNISNVDDAIKIKTNLLYSDERRQLYDEKKKVYEKIDETIKNGSLTIDFINKVDFKEIYEELYLYSKYSEYITGYYFHNKSIILTTYKSIEDIAREIAVVDVYVEKVVKDIDPSLSDFEKVIKAHDLIIDSFDSVSDLNLLEYVDANIKNIDYHTAYGAIINRETVCTGYSKIYMEILDALDIPNITLIGEMVYAHMWNLIFINGQWYHFDLTSNDYKMPDYIFGYKKEISTIVNLTKRYQYFLMNDEELSKTHKFEVLEGYESKNINAEKIRDYIQKDLLNKAYSKVAFKTEDINALKDEISTKWFQGDVAMFITDKPFADNADTKSFNAFIVKNLSDRNIYDYSSITTLSSPTPDGRHLAILLLNKF